MESPAEKVIFSVWGADTNSDKLLLRNPIVNKWVV